MERRMGMTDLSTATVVQLTAVQSAVPFPPARKPASDLPGTGPVDADGRSTGVGGNG
jgi:hypothetical protein